MSKELFQSGGRVAQLTSFDNHLLSIFQNCPFVHSVEISTFTYLTAKKYLNLIIFVFKSIHPPWHLVMCIIFTGDTTTKNNYFSKQMPLHNHVFQGKLPVQPQLHNYIIAGFFSIFRRNINRLCQVLLYARRIFYKIDMKNPLNHEAANL